MDITTATPVEIDTCLKALYEQSLVIGSEINRAMDSLHYAVKDKKEYRGRSRNGVWKMTSAETLQAAEALVASDAPSWDKQSAQRALADYKKGSAARKENISEQQTLNEEFIARGGWTRAFLAVGNGMLHVHSSMDCSSCNKGLEPTRFDWRTEFSGKQETDVVEAAGERACTVCYPTAPVAIRNRPTTIFSPAEIEAQKAREERAEKAAAKKALEVTVEGMGQNYRDGIHRPKTYKTERAVELEISSALTSLAVWGETHPTAPQWRTNVQNCAQALADRRGTTVEAIVEPIKARVAKKVAKY